MLHQRNLKTLSLGRSDQLCLQSGRLWQLYVMRETFASVLMARNASALGKVFDAVKLTGVQFQ
jgi:hypothetical protein